MTLKLFARSGFNIHTLACRAAVLENSKHASQDSGKTHIRENDEGNPRTRWKTRAMPNKTKFDPKLHSDLTKRQLKKFGIQRPQKKEKKLSRVKRQMLRR